MRTNIINITLSYEHILYTEVVYINYFINSLNIYINKTSIPSFGTLFTYPSIDKKLYYSGSLSLNKNINLISIGL